MNKLFSKIAALSVGLAMAVGVGVALGHQGVREVRAEDELVYTLTPASGSNNSYAGNCDIEISGITWNLTGNSTVQPWRIGGKSLSGVDRALYSKTVISDNVSKIEVTHGSASNITVNSMTLIVATDADFSSVVSTLTPTFAASSTVTIERPTDKSWENCYYKFVYNVTVSGSSNKFVEFTEAKFYKESGDPSKDTLVVKLNDSTESPLALDYSPTGSWLFYANDKDGKDINSDWTSSDESVFTVSKNGNNVAVVVPHNPGTANLVASADGFNDGVFVLTVNAGTLESLEVTGSMSKTSYTTNDVWSPAGLVATGTYDTGYVGDVTSQVTWSYNPATPAEGVTSVVATATIGSVSDDSAAQTVTVKVTHAGTADDPFTVEEALDKAASAGTTAWVTKGIISYVKSIDTGDYGNAEYYISDDGTRNNELLVYRGKYLNNAKFTAETAALLTVGKIATITGKLKVYNSTKEYDSGNYLLALEDQPTGDVDVVFTPSETSIEIGDTGTYTATSNTAGVVFSWSVDKPEVLSVDASTGEYEALGLGVARVTVTATAGDKVGSTYADITVNGSSYMSVGEAVALAATVESGKTTDYYIYVEGYVKEFATSTKDGQPRAFDIQTENQESSIMVYTNVNPYADFIAGLSLGTAIRVKAQVQNYNGKYELLNPVKISSEYVALTFAYELLSLTDAVCEGYDGVTDNHDAIASIWETLSPKYSGLNDAQKGRLVNPTIYGMGDTVKNAMARYDYLTGKYDLTNFITGRTPVQSNYTPSVTFGSNNNSYIIIIVISAISVMSFGLALFLRKKRSK